MLRLLIELVIVAVVVFILLSWWWRARQKALPPPTLDEAHFQELLRDQERMDRVMGRHKH
jgi:hypothetical protein